MLNIKEIMHKDVITVSKDDTVHKAIEMMVENSISCLIITHLGKPVGILTRKDILEKVILPGFSPKENYVGSYMTEDPETIDEDETIVNAMEKMVARKIKHLPVVRGNRLVGIVTQTDITFDTFNKLNISDYIELMNSIFKEREKEHELDSPSFG